MSIIYETKGRAREYFELAANLYSGCAHGCVYCYGAHITKKTPGEFGRPQARDGVIKQLQKDAARLPLNEVRHILLSFMTDPYQPLEEELRLTRRAIGILHAEALSVAILTKAPTLATRDFDLLTDKDLFGTTLTFLDPKLSRKWEPRADLPGNRIRALEEAHNRGIPTFVSLEPVIYQADTLALIEETAGFVDQFKVGKLNYYSQL